MNFKLTKPCSNCPFRKDGGIRLRRERAREIAMAATDAQGGTFPCHKTTRHDDDGEAVRHGDEQYCAGALAFALNVGRFNQFLRTVGRLGMWRPDAVQERDAVFGSVSEMVAAQGKR